MENIDANKLINRIQKKIIDKTISFEELVNDLKMLRQFALQEKNPTITKVLRMTYEHIEEYEGFNIPVPADEEVDEIDGETIDATNKVEGSVNGGIESLNYLLSLLMHSNNKANVAEIIEYRDALKDYSDNN